MNDIPRRIQMEKMVPAELAIRNAMIEVEKAGAHELLTDAIVLLGDALEKVGDFTDKQDSNGNEK